MVLRAWLAERKGQPSDPAFPTISGSQLSHDGLQYLLNKHLTVAGRQCPSLATKRVTPHVLRHTLAMDLLHHGVDRSVIALWLGHELVETTAMDPQADMRLKEQALAKTDAADVPGTPIQARRPSLGLPEEPLIMPINWPEIIRVLRPPDVSLGIIRRSAVMPIMPTSALSSYVCHSSARTVRRRAPGSRPALRRPLDLSRSRQYPTYLLVSSGDAGVDDGYRRGCGDAGWERGRMTPLAPLITRFLCDYMPRQRGYSPHSCEAYAISFKLLFEFAAKRTRTRPSQLSIEQLDAPRSLTSWRTSNGNVETAPQRATCGSPPSKRSCTTSSTRFLRARTERPDRGNPSQAPRPESDPLSDDGGGASDSERARSCDAVGHEGSGNDAPLCFAGGLRVSELVSVLAANVSLGRTPSVMVQGKGRKERCLPLWKETARDLRAWLSVRGSVRVPELFVNAEGAPMICAGFEYVLRQARPRCSRDLCVIARPRISPHQLRHSCAMVMLSKTHDVRRWRYGSAMPTSAATEAISAWIQRKARSWVEAVFRQSCAAVVQGAGCIDRRVAGRDNDGTLIGPDYVSSSAMVGDPSGTALPYWPISSAARTMARRFTVVGGMRFGVGRG